MRASLLLLLLSGCFVIDDLDRFETDPGCDLQMELRDFSIHAGRHLFTIEVVSGNGNSGEGTQTRAIAIFDPLPARNIDIDMPDAVPARTNVDGEEGMSIDFWADQSGNRTFDDRDHRWRIDDACTTAPNEFFHTLDFDPLPNPSGSGSDLVVDFCERFEGMGFSADAALEVRVHGTFPANPEVDGDVERERAIAFYRLAQARGVDEIRIPKAIDDGQEMAIEVIIDADGNGVFNPDDGDPATVDDFGLRYEYALEDCSRRMPCVADQPVFACRTTEGDVSLSISPLHVENRRPPEQASWWHRVADGE